MQRYGKRGVNSEYKFQVKLVKGDKFHPFPWTYLNCEERGDEAFKLKVQSIESKCLNGEYEKCEEFHGI